MTRWRSGRATSVPSVRRCPSSARHSASRVHRRTTNTMSPCSNHRRRTVLLPADLHVPSRFGRKRKESTQPGIAGPTRSQCPLASAMPMWPACSPWMRSRRGREQKRKRLAGWCWWRLGCRRGWRAIPIQALPTQLDPQWLLHRHVLPAPDPLLSSKEAATWAMSATGRRRRGG